MRSLIILCFAFFCSNTNNAQKIYGNVYNDTGDLLPFASVTVKGTSIGTSANNQGNFSLSLPAGSYTLICQHIGYASVEKVIVLSANMEISFILSQQKLEMKEVIVKSGGEDPAYEIIRQAIKKRAFYRNQVKSFTCNIYGKDILKLRHLPNKMFGKKIKEEDKKEMGLDSSGKGILYLSESISKISKQLPDKFKLEVVSSRVSGSGSFGFTFPSFISLYQNNVTVFTERLNPRGFISPIADRAISFYKFKFLGTFFEDGKAINSILVTPRRTYEPLFSGIINITDNDWRIHSFDLMLTKNAQLEIIDSLQITQLHVPVTEEVWRTKNQLLHFNMKFFGIDLIGNFHSIYSDYNIEPAFNTKFFDRVLIKYDTAVNKHTIAYWDSARAVPLEPEELKDYRVKDSIYVRNKDSLFSLQNIDTLKKRQGKIKILSVFIKGIQHTHYSKVNQYEWGIDPLILNTEYNTAEGVAIKINGYLSKSMKRSKAMITFAPLLRYGFNNGHLNPSASLIWASHNNDPDDKIKNYAWIISGGKRISEFNKESTIHPVKNTLNTLLLGNNFTKTYENYFGSIGFIKRFESGFRLHTNVEYENRFPLDNTTNYTFRKKDSIRITPNYPYLKIPAQFTPHQAVIVLVEFSFRPGQRYIQLPKSKIPLGSKYPTFNFTYVKGIPNLFRSDVDFDKWKISVTDDKNLRLAGTFRYKLGMGGFLNSKSVYIQDYTHFNRNSGKLNSFELVPFYKYSTTSSFYSFGHVEHHFNGLLTNKIPLFKRLNWNLLAGSNAYYINNNNNYIELFAGIENIFKILRVDAVAGYAPGIPVITGIRFSAGGILGDRIIAQFSMKNKSVNIDF